MINIVKLRDFKTWRFAGMLQHTLNNIVALWRLGARNILELPLLAASSKMETAPMAGKPDNPAMSPHAPEKNRHPSHWYTVESRGWGGREQKPLNAPHTMLLLPATLINKRYSPKRSPKHEVFHACASILKPLTNRLQSLLVVYLVKLRLTSFWKVTVTILKIISIQISVGPGPRLRKTILSKI